MAGSRPAGGFQTTATYAARIFKGDRIERAKRSRRRQRAIDSGMLHDGVGCQKHRIRLLRNRSWPVRRFPVDQEPRDSGASGRRRPGAIRQTLSPHHSSFTRKPTNMSVTAIDQLRVQRNPHREKQIPPAWKVQPQRGVVPP